MLRLKGIVTLSGNAKPVIIQGVQDLYDMQRAVAAENPDDGGKLVFIGRNLSQEKLEQSLVQWMSV